jgi:hypothetical protein
VPCVPPADDLLDHASRLIAAPAVADIDCRRAVSASYYAVFDLISAAVAAQASPQEPVGLRGRCQRALEHRPMKNAMASFLTPDSVKKLSEEVAVPCGLSPDIAMIAKVYGEMQDERHLADYDVVDSEGKVGLRGPLRASIRLSRSLRPGIVLNRQMKQSCFWHLSFLAISG